MRLGPFRLGTNAAYVKQDLLTVTIEESNFNGSTLTLGSRLISDPGRSKFGVLQAMTNPSIPFVSYRLLVTSKKDIQNSVEYSEVQLIFY
ncbi:hypothetical protein I4U23_021871 [Adineta vaga]|nr:hypothetical protein I4U23_021871 [Adineta vaga]